MDGEYVITTVGNGIGAAPGLTEVLAPPVWDFAGWMMDDPNKKVIDDYFASLSVMESRAAQLRAFDAYWCRLVRAALLPDTGGGVASETIADAEPRLTLGNLRLMRPVRLRIQ